MTRAVTLALLTVSGTLPTGPGARASDDPKVIAQKLESPNLPERDAAARRVLNDRWQLIQALLKMLDERIGPDASRGDREIAHGVITLLGKMRAVEAVPVLVENMTFRRRPHGPGMGPAAGAPPSIEGDLPAIAALIRIGARSLDPVAKKVLSTDDAVTLRAGAIVYCGVLGPRLARLAVQDLIDQEQDLNRRARLVQLLRMTEEIGRNPTRELIE
jgi:hypothetical protein